MSTAPRKAMTGTTTATVCAAVQSMVLHRPGMLDLLEDVDDSSSRLRLPLIRARSEQPVDAVLAGQLGERHRIVAVAPAQPPKSAVRRQPVDVVWHVEEEALKQVRRS